MTLAITTNFIRLVAYSVTRPHAWLPLRPRLRRRANPGVYSVARRRIGRYVPSVGFEHFENVAIKSGDAVIAEPFSGSAATFRLFLQWFPFNRAIKPGDIRFTIEADGHLRRLLADRGDLDDTLRSLSVNATWYLVAPQRLGVGLSGEFGQMPSTNFIKQNRIVLALRVKVAGP